MHGLPKPAFFAIVAFLLTNTLAAILVQFFFERLVPSSGSMDAVVRALLFVWAPSLAYAAFVYKRAMKRQLRHDDFDQAK
jgi:hypothetical protein